MKNPLKRRENAPQSSFMLNGIMTNSTHHLLFVYKIIKISFHLLYVKRFCKQLAYNCHVYVEKIGFVR